MEILLGTRNDGGGGNESDGVGEGAGGQKGRRAGEGRQTSGGYPGDNDSRPAHVWVKGRRGREGGREGGRERAREKVERKERGRE